MFCSMLHVPEGSSAARVGYLDDLYACRRCNGIVCRATGYFSVIRLDSRPLLFHQKAQHSPKSPTKCPKQNKIKANSQ